MYFTSLLVYLKRIIGNLNEVILMRERRERGLGSRETERERREWGRLCRRERRECTCTER